MKKFWGKFCIIDNPVKCENLFSETCRHGVQADEDLQNIHEFNSARCFH